MKQNSLQRTPLHWIENPECPGSNEAVKFGQSGIGFAPWGSRSDDESLMSTGIYTEKISGSQVVELVSSTAGHASPTGAMMHSTLLGGSNTCIGTYGRGSGEA